MNIGTLQFTRPLVKRLIAHVQKFFKPSRIIQETPVQVRHPSGSAQL